MAINTMDGLVSAFANNADKFFISKGSFNISYNGASYSYWTIPGQPGGAAIPTSAAVPTNTTAGSIPITNQTSPINNYIGYFTMMSGMSPGLIEVVDRLAHMGGLVGNVTTAQTVGLNLNSLLSTGNLTERIGPNNYSEVKWMLEWYAATGSSAVTATVAVTYSDSSTGTLTVPIASNRHIYITLDLNQYVPNADSGKNIMAVNSITLSGSTGTAGNFGVTAYRPLANIPLYIGSKFEAANWQNLGLPKVINSSALSILYLNANNGGASGLSRGTLVLIKG